jgi:hypothetical protein
MHASRDGQDFQTKRLISRHAHQIDPIEPAAQMNIGHKKIETAFIQKANGLFGTFQSDDLKLHLAQDLVLDLAQSRIVFDQEYLSTHCHHAQSNQVLEGGELTRQAAGQFDGR